MKIYRLEKELDGYTDLFLTNKDDIKLLKKYLDNAPLGENWREIDIKVYNEGNYTDIPALWIDSKILILSGKSIEILKDFFPKNTEYLKLNNYRYDYYIVHICSTLDEAVDYDNSIIERLGKVPFSFSKIAFRPEVVKNIDVFKDSIGLYEIYVSEKFRQAVINSNLEGFNFVEVWNCEEVEDDLSDYVEYNLKPKGEVLNSCEFILGPKGEVLKANEYILKAKEEMGNSENDIENLIRESENENYTTETSEGTDFYDNIDIEEEMNFYNKKEVREYNKHFTGNEDNDNENNRENEKNSDKINHMIFKPDSHFNDYDMESGDYFGKTEVTYKGELKTNPIDENKMEKVISKPIIATSTENQTYDYKKEEIDTPITLNSSEIDNNNSINSTNKGKHKFKYRIRKKKSHKCKFKIFNPYKAYENEEKIDYNGQDVSNNTIDVNSQYHNMNKQESVNHEAMFNNTHGNYNESITELNEEEIRFLRECDKNLQEESLYDNIDPSEIGSNYEIASEIKISGRNYNQSNSNNSQITPQTTSNSNNDYGNNYEEYSNNYEEHSNNTADKNDISKNYKFNSNSNVNPNSYANKMESELDDSYIKNSNDNRFECFKDLSFYNKKEKKEFEYKNVSDNKNDSIDDSLDQNSRLKEKKLNFYEKVEEKQQQEIYNGNIKSTNKEANFYDRKEPKQRILNSFKGIEEKENLLTDISLKNKNNYNEEDKESALDFYNEIKNSDYKDSYYKESEGDTEDPTVKEAENNLTDSHEEYFSNNYDNNNQDFYNAYGNNSKENTNSGYYDYQNDTSNEVNQNRSSSYYNEGETANYSNSNFNNPEDEAKTNYVYNNEYYGNKTQYVNNENYYNEIEEQRNQRIIEDLRAENQGFLRHINRYLGKIKRIFRSSKPMKAPVDVIFVEGRGFNSILTNGMRYFDMNVPKEYDEYKNIELIMFLDKRFDLSEEGLKIKENFAILNMIRAVSQAPFESNMWLSSGHTLTNIKDLEYMENMNGLFVYPPIMQGDLNFLRYTHNFKNTYIYNVMPISNEELNFIVNYGGDQFFEILYNLGLGQVIIGGRRSIINYR